MLTIRSIFWYGTTARALALAAPKNAQPSATMLPTVITQARILVVVLEPMQGLSRCLPGIA
jgi:hypothetical protein